MGDTMENYKNKLKNEITAFGKKVLENNNKIVELNLKNIEYAEEIQMRMQRLKYYEINEKGYTQIVEGQSAEINA